MKIYTIRASHKPSADLRYAIDCANKSLGDSGDSMNYDNVVREYRDLLDVFGENSVYIDWEEVSAEE